MWQGLLRNWAWCGAGLLSIANLAYAQEVKTLPASAAAGPSLNQEHLLQRIERLEKQNQELLNAIRQLQSIPPAAPIIPSTIAEDDPTPKAETLRTDVRSIVGEMMKEKADAEAAKKKKEDEEGFAVGKHLTMSGRWNHGAFLETPDKSFKMSLGGRTQFDTVFVRAADNVIDGMPGGFGTFDDAVNFRRARLDAIGSFYETFNFYTQFDFVNTFDSGNASTPPVTGRRNLVFDTPAPTDLWIEATQIPYFRVVRVGNQKPPIGLEHMTSSRFLNFMERSYGFDAFEEDGDNGFAPGITNINWSEDEKWTYHVGLIKTTRNVFGWNVGDGEWGGYGRFGYLPYWSENGRCMMWVGLGAMYRDLDDGSVRMRARTMLRNGPAALHTISVISQLDGNNQKLLNPEFAFQWGPLNVNAEYQASWIDGVTNIVRTPTQSNVKLPGVTYFGQSAYVEILYFLTGEHRDFNRRMPAWGRVIPYQNAFWVAGEHGVNLFGKGAWQIGARYSWIDLNNRDVLGGEVHSLTLGLNWFLNPNFKIQWNVEAAHRNVVVGPASGDYQGAGMRFAWDF